MGQVILQWNCRGLIPNVDDINHLLHAYGAACFCLQETYLTTKSDNIFRHYNSYRKDRVDAARASGGVAILTSKSIPTKHISLVTDLEAVAVQICLDKIMTVCSLYLPPSAVVEQRQLENLFNQLPRPFLILGDFNAHNPLWGGTKVDTRGKIVENVLISNPICLLNTGTPTYVNAATQSFSALDLSICSPSLYQDIDWSVYENPYGSDHFPVILKFRSMANNLSTRPARWKLSEADWVLFREEADLSLLSFQDATIEQQNNMITESIISAAIHSIPQTSGRLPGRPKPWWTADCQASRKAQNKAWGIFRRYPTAANLLIFKQARAKARWTRRRAKRDSWRSFVTSLNCNTPSKMVWDRLRKIKGDYAGFTVPLMKVNGALCSSMKEQADAIGEHFQNVSSSSHYSKEFLKVKETAEKVSILGSAGGSQTYNQPFNMTELTRALAVCKVTAPGPDRITYSMLQNLSVASQQCLLQFYNQVWKEAWLPSSWKVATVIPLLKPGKDPSNPSSFRPIALTSCLGKTFERMVNCRLMYYLEANKVLCQYQCAFRAAHSTVDHLVRLESIIREAFVNRQHCISVFFDMEKHTTLHGGMGSYAICIPVEYVGDSCIA